MMNDSECALFNALLPDDFLLKNLNDDMTGYSLVFFRREILWPTALCLGRTLCHAILSYIHGLYCVHTNDH